MKKFSSLPLGSFLSCINGGVVATITSIVFVLSVSWLATGHETGSLMFCVSIFTLVIALVSS